MNRYKKRGWFKEPVRHSLASRGISTTRKYLQQKSLFGPGHKLDGMAEDLRRRDVNEKKEEMVKKLSKKVADGELTGDNRERFMEGPFRKLAEDYMNKVIDKEQFDREVDIKFKSFTKTHSRKLPVFKVMSGEAI